MNPFLVLHGITLTFEKICWILSTHRAKKKAGQFWCLVFGLNTGSDLCLQSGGPRPSDRGPHPNDRGWNQKI